MLRSRLILTRFKDMSQHTAGADLDRLLEDGQNFPGFLNAVSFY